MYVYVVKEAKIKLRWPSSQEYMLLLQRTQVQFPVPTNHMGRSQPPVTPVPENPTAGLFWNLQAHDTHINKQTYTYI